MTVRRAGWLAFLLVAGLVVASCAPRLDAKAPTATNRPATAANNRERTLVEAQRLLTLAALPPGGQVLSHASASLRWPGGGAPDTTSLVDQTRFWKVPMPFAAAFDWVPAHPPVGLTLSGTSGAPNTTTGYSYSDRASRYWTGAELVVTVTADGSGASDWRIDGMAEWLDPRPMTDRSTGHRIHVTAVTGCPGSDRGIVGVTNPGAGLDAALLPPGRPTGALVCAYVGMNGARFTLRHPRTLSAAQAVWLAAAARAVTLWHVDGLTFACPSGDASADVIAFAYPGRTVDLWYADYGCPSVANGVISSMGSMERLSDAIRSWSK